MGTGRMTATEDLRELVRFGLLIHDREPGDHISAQAIADLYDPAEFGLTRDEILAVVKDELGKNGMVT